MKVMIWRWKYFKSRWKVERITHSFSITLGRLVICFLWHEPRKPTLDEFLRDQNRQLRWMGK